MTLIRYPGSKTKLRDAIIGQFPDAISMALLLDPDAHYIEPFIGSGAIAFEVMRHIHYKAAITLADADIGIACLWKAVQRDPKSLIRRIMSFTPTVEAFYELKRADGEYTDTIDTGFRKLALHRISVSGFGYMAGGPIGGKSQQSDYTVDCRWKPERMIRTVSSLHRLFSRFKRLDIRHADVFDVLDDAANSCWQEHGYTFAYLDPPYYEKGDQLYKHKFTPEHHERLAEFLMRCPFDWALSYDDHEEIHRLYQGCRFLPLKVTYTNAVCTEATRRKNQEILITPAIAGVDTPLAVAKLGTV